MDVKDFYYDLPEELIAQVPISKRDESRLMILDREKQQIQHKTFKDIISYFRKGDTLVLNDGAGQKAYIVESVSSDGKTITFSQNTPIQDDGNFDVDGNKVFSDGKNGRIFRLFVSI